MERDAPCGVDHLLRATRDARVADAEFERRIAGKNAVVARAFQHGQTSLDDALELLYDPNLSDAVAVRRPNCPVAARILEIGCELSSLAGRLLKWSPDLERLLMERFDLLLL